MVTRWVLLLAMEDVVAFDVSPVQIPTVLAPVPFDLNVMDGFDILFPQPVPTPCTLR